MSANRVITTHRVRELISRPWDEWRVKIVLAGPADEMRVTPLVLDLSPAQARELIDDVDHIFRRGQWLECAGPFLVPGYEVSNFVGDRSTIFLG